jgi:hypothetical protein
MKKAGLYIVSLFLLGGCAHPLPTPVDPYHGIAAAAGKSDEPMDISTFQDKPLGLLLSVNTRNLIEWQAKEIEESHTGFVSPPLVGTSGTGLSGQLDDIGGVATGVLDTLHGIFKDIILVPNMAAAHSRGLDTVVVLDLQEWEDACSSTMGDCYYTARAQYTLGFVDVQTGKWIGIIRVAGPVSYCSQQRVGEDAVRAKCLEDARNTALEMVGPRLRGTWSKPATTLSNDEKHMLENAQPEELYSLGLRLEQSQNIAGAEEVYQAMAKRFPDNPYTVKAVQRQETLVVH